MNEEKTKKKEERLSTSNKMTQLVVENIKVFNLDHRYRKHYASFLQLFRTRVERPFEETLIFHAYRNDRRPRFHPESPPCASTSSPLNSTRTHLA